jgi:UDP-3-O-[3-hydroxymyristoyl] glucosamine N-acyltransferase
VADHTAGELAERVGGRIEGDPDRRVTGVAPVEEAGPGDLTFVVDRHRARDAEAADPAVVLVPEGIPLRTDATLVRVERPRRAFAELVLLFRPEAEDEDGGIHPTALVDEGARIGGGVTLGPRVVVGAGARVGRETRIGAHTVVGGGARIGEECRIGDSCSIRGSVRMGDRVRVLPGARLGTEGYGYAEEDEDGTAVHIPQVGKCVIGDDVEIGANTTIDRGALEDTVVGARTKIDNLVHVGHNVRIGEDCMIVAQVGIAGSSRVGDRAQLGGRPASPVT